MKADTHTVLDANSSNLSQVESSPEYKQLLGLRSLNHGFLSHLQRQFQLDAFSDLSGFFQSYIDHRSEVVAREKSVPETNGESSGTANSKSTPMPVFSFGNSNSITSAGSADPKPGSIQFSKESTPASVQFPNPEEKSGTSSPSGFIFNPPKYSVSSAKAPVFTFNPTTPATPATKDAENQDAPKSSFSFTPKNSTMQSGLSFSFGGSKSVEKNDELVKEVEPVDDEKENKIKMPTSMSMPTFQFGTPTTNNSSSTNLWSANKSVLFASSEKKPESKSSEETPNETPSVSAFSSAPSNMPVFGGFKNNNTGSSTMPSVGFSFGSSSSTALDAKTDDVEKVDKPISSEKEGIPVEASSPENDKNNELTQNQVPENSNSESKEKVDAVEADNEPSDNTPVTTTTTTTDAPVSGAGEEDEDTVHTVKAKIFKLQDQKWKEYGVGVVKINVNKETGKARILARTDNFGPVLLNESLNPQFKYQLERSTIKFPVPNELKPGTLTQCLLRVRNANMAKELKESMESNSK